MKKLKHNSNKKDNFYIILCVQVIYNNVYTHSDLYINKH